MVRKQHVAAVGENNTVKIVIFSPLVLKKSFAVALQII